jgi:N-methylhydantoinase A
MVVAPTTRDVLAAVMRTVDGDDVPATLSPLIASLTARVRDELAGEGHDVRRLTAEVSLSMRYAGQSYELSVPVAAPSRTGPRPRDLAPERLRAAFHAAHQQRYGHADPARPVEAVTLRVRAVLPPPRIALTPTIEPGEARAGTTTVWFDRPRRATILLRERLKPGAAFAGPAIVPPMDATTVVPPGWRARVDDAANLILKAR